MSDFNGFGPDLQAFLAEVAQNNDKDWFEKNRKRFQQNVQAPTLAFVRAMAPHLEGISPQLVANDRKVGGSMMRFFRDTRFSKDKSPYNTHVSLQFFHRDGKGNAAPGLFMRITSDELVVGTGIFKPETALANRIRGHIAENPGSWTTARDDKAFKKAFGELEGDSLKRPPKGFDKEHPLVEDLKRKDFVAFASLNPKWVTDKKLPERVTKVWSTSKPLLAFLADSVGVPF